MTPIKASAGKSVKEEESWFGWLSFDEHIGIASAVFKGEVLTGIWEDGQCHFDEFKRLVD